jgi:hypothetical protein
VSIFKINLIFVLYTTSSIKLVITTILYVFIYQPKHTNQVKLINLQAKLGYTFNNILLLKQALTRQSAVEEGLALRTQQNTLVGNHRQG